MVVVLQILIVKNSCFFLGVPAAKMESETDTTRKALQINIAFLAREVGFQTIQEQALNKLTNVFETILFQFGKTTREYTELAGRTQSTLHDVEKALALCADLKDLSANLKRYSHNPHSLAAPAALTKLPKQLDPIPKQRQDLTTGCNILDVIWEESTVTMSKSIFSKGPRPSHIPNYYPEMPHISSYIRRPLENTPPVLDYLVYREKIAKRNRDGQNLLVNYFVRNSPCDYMCGFPVLPPKPVSYFDAIVSKDQYFPEATVKIAEIDGEMEQNDTGNVVKSINPFLRSPTINPLAKKTRAPEIEQSVLPPCPPTTTCSELIEAEPFDLVTVKSEAFHEELSGGNFELNELNTMMDAKLELAVSSNVDPPSDQPFQKRSSLSKRLEAIMPTLDLMLPIPKSVECPTARPLLSNEPPVPAAYTSATVDHETPMPSHERSPRVSASRWKETFASKSNRTKRKRNFI